MWILGKWAPSWELGNPACREGEKAGSWHQTEEKDRHSGMRQDSGGGLVTTPSHVYAQSVIVHCIIIIVSKDHNKNRALLCYLFQENKSFGSKTPFAFILWCTGSCAEQNLFSLLLQTTSDPWTTRCGNDILKVN